MDELCLVVLSGSSYDLFLGHQSVSRSVGWLVCLSERNRNNPHDDDDYHEAEYIVVDTTVDTPQYTHIDEPPAFIAIIWPATVR